MLHALKALFVALLASMLFVPPLQAQDKTVDRSKLTREQTFKQLAKDLAGLQRVVEKETKDLVKEEILCPEPTASDPKAAHERFLAKAEKLIDDGYGFRGMVEKQTKHSYVGIGLRLRPYAFNFGTVIDGTIPGSPAEQSGFFGKEYFVLAVDGIPLPEAPMTPVEVVRKAILGSGKAHTGVVLTLQGVPDGREYVRFFERKRLRQTVMCVRYVK